MGKSKTTKSYIGNENSGQCLTQILCNSCCYKNPINLVCTDQKCEKQDQLQAICATCHYNLYHSSVSLETYLQKIEGIFQESLAIIEIDQKKLLQFQESLNQTYFMIENLKLKTYEQLQEQENQRQQLLSLIGSIKNLDENKQISPQTLKDKVREISKILVLNPKSNEEKPLSTTMNFYREFVYQCEMEIWIKFNRYFTQKRDWAVKTEEETDNVHNIAHINPHPAYQVLNGTGNILTLTKTDLQIRENSQRDNLKKDLLYPNQMETENPHSKNEDYRLKNKISFCDESNNSNQEEEEEEEVQFEVERNLDEDSDKSEPVDDDIEEDDEEEEDEDDGDFQYKQRRRKSNTHGNNSKNNISNGQSNYQQNGSHSLRNKSISTFSRYQDIANNNHNDFNQSSSHSNGSTAVPKGTHGTIRKIRELSVKEKQTILQEYDSTGDIRSISTKYNIKYRRLYNFIQNSRGPNNQSIRQYSDEDKQFIYNDYLETKNVREVANKWKLNYDSLYSFIRYKKQK